MILFLHPLGIELLSNVVMFYLCIFMFNANQEPFTEAQFLLVI